MGVRFLATGKCLPKRKVENDELTNYVDTNHDWIVGRTGIEARYIAEEETNLDLAMGAVHKALQSANIAKEEIGLLVAATVTPDQLVPTLSSMLKDTLDLPNAVAFDVNAACSGFLYSSYVAESLMRTQGIRYALVVGSERLSRITNWKERSTCVLFGDGAGAALLELDENSPGILGTFLKNYDDKHKALECEIDYVVPPFVAQPEPASRVIRMKGTQVFRFAVTAIVEVIEGVLEKTGILVDEIKYFVPHQANLRIIKYAAERFDISLDRFMINIEETGNTSAASIPMALDDLIRSGVVEKGDKIMLIGFGGGLTAGAMLVEI